MEVVIVCALGEWGVRKSISQSIAREGSRARNTPGKLMMFITPLAARIKSHINVTIKWSKLFFLPDWFMLRNFIIPGANNRDRREVPRRWTIKRAIRKAYKSSFIREIEVWVSVWRGKGNYLTIDIDAVLPETCGFANAIPETALVTQVAGVRIPSAIVKLVPKRA